MKMKNQIAGRENARHETAGHPVRTSNIDRQSNSAQQIENSHSDFLTGSA